MLLAFVSYLTRKLLKFNANIANFVCYEKYSNISKPTIIR